MAKAVAVGYCHYNGPDLRKKAPLIVTRDMVAAMRPGSVVVDLAAETGGNVEDVLPARKYS